MNDTINRQPMLAYSTEFDRWVLKFQGSQTDPEVSYEMLIQCAYQDELGWFSYRFVRWDMGEWVEMLTFEQFRERVANIRENEGDRVAEAWVAEQEQYEVISEAHPIFKLRAHWEAMMTLNLFFPAITMREWKGKPLHPELKAKLDAISNEERIAGYDGDNHAHETVEPLKLPR